jgi:hypothetical protein
MSNSLLPEITGWEAVLRRKHGLRRRHGCVPPRKSGQANSDEQPESKMNAVVLAVGEHGGQVNYSVFFHRHHKIRKQQKVGRQC